MVGGETLLLRPSFAALVAAEEELGPLFALVERARGRAAEARRNGRLVLALRRRPAATAAPRRRIGEALARDGSGQGDAGAEGAADADPAGPCLATAPARLAGMAGALLGWRPDEFWHGDAGGAGRGRSKRWRAAAPAAGRPPTWRGSRRCFPIDPPRTSAERGDQPAEPRRGGDCATRWSGQVPPPPRRSARVPLARPRRGMETDG